jgi:pilus assembly protein CpaB
VTARRRRGLLLVSVALASGGLAASQAHERERRAARELGPEVEVLVAARDLSAGTRVVRGALAFRRVPVRFAPPDALASSAGVAGARLAVPVQAGAYLTAGSFAGTSNRDEYGLRRGERAVTVEVAAGLADGGPPPGSRVDVLVSTDGPGGGRTQMALAGAELLRLGAAPAAYADADAPTAPSGPTALATLRVTTRQAVYLAAADNFAREIRLLIRPPGDRSRAGAAVIRGDL